MITINKAQNALLAFSIGCLALFAPSAHADNKPTAHAAITKPVITKSHAEPPSEALKYAINGYRWAVKHHEVRNPGVLTLVDFSKPSYEKRLWVIDLKNDHVLMNMHVAQARNTGAVYAKRFSNQPGSRESSPGVFTTQDVYDGEHGESLRVNGLESGINNNALSRAVVIHPAAYMTPSFIKQNGYAGRSWGCFAVNPAKADKFIRLIKGGSVLFAYASPEERDPHVDHGLSSAGEKIYDRISGNNENFFERIFHI